MTQNQNYVKANMNFYHDAVGSRAKGEVFQVRNSKSASELESMGYVSQVDSDEMQQNLKLQEEVGKVQALTNEAVSLASHAHNVEANKHSQSVQELRRKQQQAQQEQTHNEQNSAQSAKVTQAPKKANEK